MMAALAAAVLSSCGAAPLQASADAPAARAEPRVSPAGLDLATLTITSHGKPHRLTVEVARTGAEQAKGLMFRTELAPDAGMIFPFPSPRPASFWMKNTVIPLDIIFIRADGSIESIAANTVPYSLDPVQSGEEVGAVLEIPAGRAAALGIEPGDMVRWADQGGSH